MYLLRGGSILLVCYATTLSWAIPVAKSSFDGSGGGGASSKAGKDISTPEPKEQLIPNTNDAAARPTPPTSSLADTKLLSFEGLTALTGVGGLTWKIMSDKQKALVRAHQLEKQKMEREASTTGRNHGDYMWHAAVRHTVMDLCWRQKVCTVRKGEKEGTGGS